LQRKKMGNQSSTPQPVASPAASPSAPAAQPSTAKPYDLATGAFYIPTVPAGTSFVTSDSKICFDPKPNPILVQFKKTVTGAPFCQWLNPQTQAWQNWPQFSTKEQCESANQCSQGGACYQWSTGVSEVLTPRDNFNRLSNINVPQVCVSPSDDNKSVLLEWAAPTAVPAPMPPSVATQTPTVASSSKIDTTATAVAPSAAQMDEIKVYNNLADALLNNDPKFVPVVKTYFPPQVTDQVFTSAMTYLKNNRPQAIEMARRIGFAKQGATGDVSRPLARWVSQMSRAEMSRADMSQRMRGAQAAPSKPVDHSPLVLGIVLLLAAAGLGYYLYRRKQNKTYLKV
jgi:putative component of toxin-antitoxin plasmid stabilization module